MRPMWMLPLLALLLTTDIPAQTVAPSQTAASDPQAAAIAQQAMLVLTGGTGIADVTLIGTAQWTAGSLNTSGPITLKARGAGQSRVDLSLNGGSRREIRDASAGRPVCSWVDASGASHTSALHNCMTDAAWFFPALTSLSGGPNVVLSYVGQESRGGVSVHHLRSYVSHDSQDPVLWATIQELSSMDFYLDSSSLLPVALAFNLHPDTDSNTRLPVEIHFSNYQRINGINVPLHIQKYWNGGLTLDISISSVAVNTGLTASAFAN